MCLCVQNQTQERRTIEILHKNKKRNIEGEEQQIIKQICVLNKRKNKRMGFTQIHNMLLYVFVTRKRESDFLCWSSELKDTIMTVTTIKKKKKTGCMEKQNGKIRKPMEKKTRMGYKRNKVCKMQNLQLQGN